MRILLTLSLLAALSAGTLAQDKKDKDKEIGPLKVVKLERKDPVSYDKDIEPVFYKRCVACHSGPVKEGRFDLGTYEALVKGGKRGQAIVPGKGDTSLLYKSAARTHKPCMPPAGEEPLTPEELALIKLWIDEGAKAPTGQRLRPKVIVGVPPANVVPVRAVTVSPDQSAPARGRSNQIHVTD